jgi:hypothetical protein
VSFATQGVQVTPVEVGVIEVGVHTLIGLSITVTTSKESLTHPIESTALFVVPKVEAEVRRTLTVCPFTTVPRAFVQAPPLILYSPHVIEIPVGVLIPETVIELDSITVLIATPF